MTGPDPVVIAVDAGTTNVRAVAFDRSGSEVDQATRPLVQYYPRPGWIEHDPSQIWAAARASLEEVGRRLVEAGRSASVIGVANQRETVVAWDRHTGQPLHPAIVWQDRRTAGTCDQLSRSGHLPLIRRHTGLVLDPYFSATKMAWLLSDGGVRPGRNLALATVDSWLLWNLTGGAGAGVYATDVTNASRTSLLDIADLQWSSELCDLFGVPRRALAEVRPSCGRLGTVHRHSLDPDARLAGVPISGMAGDQHAALFGQACFQAGMTKVTYGTGAFVLMNAGSHCPDPVDGLLTTVAWDLGTGIPATSEVERVAYALEGSVLASGAAIEWLRDGIGIVEHVRDVDALASSVTTNAGLTFVPAFTGLGSPQWDPYARGIIVGVSRGANRAHLARATLEAMSAQIGDVVGAMGGATGTPPTRLRVDGGASTMDTLLQLQANQTHLTVDRPRCVESTALGAATLAGLAEGVWKSLDELGTLWTASASFTPSETRNDETGHRAWNRAVERSRGWALE